MKILTDTEIPVLHADGRIIAIWLFAAGRVLERSQWYFVMPPLRPLDLETTEPSAVSCQSFEAVLSYVDGMLGYVCSSLDIAPERVARILRNVQFLAKVCWSLPAIPMYGWHLDFEGNVREGGYCPGMVINEAPCEAWGYQRVAVDPGESRLDLTIEVAAAASAWSLLRRRR